MIADRIAARTFNGQPLIFLPDETRHLDHEPGHTPLNASRSVPAAAPFLLATAGTLELRTDLDEPSATSWNRTRQLGIDGLDELEARPMSRAWWSVQEQILISI